MSAGARSYLVVETGSTQDNPNVDALLGQCQRLVEAGHRVTVYIVQNAVIGLARSERFRELLAAGAEALVDEHSLRERRLDEGALMPGMRLASMPEFVRLLMAPGVVPIWH